MAIAKTAPKKTVAKKAPAKAAKKPVSNEFAVILTGGKQYQVSVGDTVTIEKIEGLKKGDAVTFDKVLLVDNGTDTTIGTPHITGATVTGEVMVVGRAQR